MNLERIVLHWDQIVLGLFVIVWSIAIHEFSHAFAADRLGDDLPRRQGRLTILPTEHFDPIGFLMICFLQLGFMGLGWGKPVQINPGALKHPRRDMTIIAAAGPFSNLCLATIAGLAMRFTHLDGDGPDLLGKFLRTFLMTNLSLMLFNLIPIPPLDGSKILSNNLPYDLARKYESFMAQFGQMILIGMVFLGGAALGAYVIGPAQMSIAEMLTGMNWTYR